jgi:hypothetical protein
MEKTPIFYWRGVPKPPNASQDDMEISVELLEEELSGSDSHGP